MTGQTKRPKVRQVRLADMVARSLRNQILSAELADGDHLPTLDRLVQEYGVSPASVREGLRILETEGLISVRRGKFGGAIVHRPTLDAAARMIGMVLQVEGATQRDLAAALRELEPMCAGLAVRRPDAAEAVVPLLREVHQRAESVVDEPAEFERWAREFHTVFVNACGNRSLIVAVGTLECLWAEQDTHWRQRINVAHDIPDEQLRRRGLRAHEEILAAAQSGDAEKVAELFRLHTVDTATHANTAGQPIRAIGPA